MRRSNIVMTAIISIMVIIAVVMLSSGGITGRVAIPNPCADIGIIGGYNVLSEYLIEFESEGFNCYEGPQEDGFCCVK